jgi:hypothetical protein
VNKDGLVSMVKKGDSGVAEVFEEKPQREIQLKNKTGNS